MWRTVALGLVLLVSCATPRRAAQHDIGAELDRARATHATFGTFAARAVIVTIDGARWQEIFEGEDPRRAGGSPRSAAALLPNLHRLAASRGALVGAPGRGFIAASGPAYVSLPGYTEILTGRTPRDCQDNDCARATVPTVLDEAYAAGAHVAAFASWDRLERAVTAASGRFVVSCGRDGDPTIDPYPGTGAFRPDAITGYLALRYLATELPDVLFLGLGEPDEYAHRDDYDGYVRALGLADAIVGQLFDVLDRMGELGAATHVVVTTDHGRARDFVGHGGGAPESARVWLFSAGPDVVARGLVRSEADRRLADVAPTLRLMLGLERDVSPDAGRALSELLGATRAAVARTP